MKNEPTVEKWDVEKVYWSIHTHSSDEVTEARHKAVIARLTHLNDLSVQEAKAEMYREWVEELNNFKGYIVNDRKYGRSEGDIVRVLDNKIDRFKDLLASLKQEEDK